MPPFMTNLKKTKETNLKMTSNLSEKHNAADHKDQVENNAKQVMQPSET